MQRPTTGDYSGMELEAVFEAMFLTAFADDELSDAEEMRFRERAFEISGGVIDAKEFERMLGTVTRAILSEGIKTRLESVGSRLRSNAHRQAALVAAVSVARSDRLTRSERTVLEQLRKELQLPPEAIEHAMHRRSQPHDN